MKKIFVIILVFVSLTSVNVHAQYGNEFGVLGGISNYYGDLNNNNSFKGLGPHAGVFIRHNFTPRFSSKMAINWGKFSFKDAYSENTYQRARNLSFKNTIWELDLQTELSFLPFVHGDRDYFYTPYLFLGFGAMMFNPQAQYEGEWYKLADIFTEGQQYSLQQFTIPFGMGFKYDLTPEWSINLEAGYRFTFVDYLDDVSTIYTFESSNASRNPKLYEVLYDRSAELGITPIGSEGKQRGEWNNNDAYIFIGIGITYNIAGVMCPKFK